MDDLHSVANSGGFGTGREFRDRLARAVQEVETNANAERQRRFRASQKALGRKQVQMFLTPDEQFYLERVLRALREDGLTPALGRDPKGRLRVIDV